MASPRACGDNALGRVQLMGWRNQPCVFAGPLPPPGHNQRSNNQMKTMKNRMFLLTCLLLLALDARPPRATAQTTNRYVATYQGLLKERGVPADGLYNIVSS